MYFLDKKNEYYFYNIKVYFLLLKLYNIKNLKCNNVVANSFTFLNYCKINYQSNSYFSYVNYLNLLFLSNEILFVFYNFNLFSLFNTFNKFFNFNSEEFFFFRKIKMSFFNNNVFLNKYLNKVFRYNKSILKNKNRIFYGFKMHFLGRFSRRQRSSSI